MKFIFFLVLFFLIGCAKVEIDNAEKSIGEASMLQDGTIILQLRAEGESVIGDAMFTFSPDDERYNEILEHIKPISPGERKPVPPWPDDAIE